MKKILIALSLCFINSIAWGEGALTDKLIEKYAGQNVIVEYIWTQPKIDYSDGFGAQGQQPVKHSEKQRPVRPGSGEIAAQNKNNSEESINVEFPVIITGRYVYARQGENLYMQHDYPQYISEDYPEMGVEKYITQEEYKKNKKRERFNQSLIGGILTSVFGNGETKENNNDLNLLYEGKVYFLDRSKKTGKWCALEELAGSQKSSRYIMNSGIANNNAINSVLLADPKNTKVTFLGTFNKYVDGEKYLVENYSSQKLSLYGLPEGDVRMFDFYFLNDKLVYFAISDDEEGIEGLVKQRLESKQNKIMRPALAKIEKIQVLGDPKMFDVLQEYKLEKLVIK